MDLKALQRTLRQFATQRDWPPFHTPKNLAMALMVEAAELAEIYQWMTPEQSQVAHTDRVLQERIGDEVADVLLYLLQIADHAALDLKGAVDRKMLKNAKKHPPTRPGQPAGTAAQSDLQTHVLVDWENVQPKDSDIRALVPDVTDVWIFHGPNQKRAGAHHTSFGDRLTLVPIARTGKNALDFHLSFYMGYIASRHPDARFVVLSNDTGYAPMLAHATDLGFAARPLGFVKAKTPATRASTTKAPATQPRPARRTGAQAVAAGGVAARKSAAAKVPPPVAADPYAAVQPTPKRTRRSRSPVDGVVAAAVMPPAAAPAKTARRGRRDTAPEASMRPPKRPAKPPAAPSIKPAAEAPVRPKVRDPARQAGKSAERHAEKQLTKDASKDLAKAVLHVQAGLRKTANKPTRQARLLATIQSLLGASADEVRVQAVLSRLLADGTVRVDDKGRVHFAQAGAGAS